MSEQSTRISIWLLASVGVASLIGLLFLDVERRRAAYEELSSIRYLGQIRADAAIAHVWVEELLSNDQIDELDLEQRLQGLDQSMAELLAGPGVDGQAWPGPDAGDATLDDLARDIQRFQEITTDRLDGRKQGLSVGIGSRFDVIYDRVFNQLLERSRRIEDAFDRRRIRDERNQARWFQWLFALSSLASLSALWLYLRRERERRQTLQELETTERRLVRSQKIEVLGRLAGGLAHDINNYLAAVRSQCELLDLELKEGTGDPRRRARLVSGTAARAGALIDRLLAFGADAPVGDEQVDGAELLRAMGPMLESAAPDGVRVKIRWPGDLWPLAVPASFLEQAIFNLVLNGIDAVGRRGEVRVEGRNAPAGLTQAGGARDAVEIRVIDDGCGIEPGRLERIFEPFWSSKGTAGDRDHAGLGLAVVQSVVSKAGGSVAVESEPGAGTTFFLRFPRGRGAPPVAKQKPGHDARGSAGPDIQEVDPSGDLGGDQRLLLVDDHEELREATAIYLETFGYDVRAAASLAEASRLVAEQLPDAVVLDLSLGDGDGLAWLEQIRERHGPLPAVVYTGSAGEALVSGTARCEAMGVSIVGKGAHSRQLLCTLQGLWSEGS